MRRFGLLTLATLWGCAADGIDPALTAEDLVLTEAPAAPVALPEGVRLRIGTYNLHGAQDGTPEAIGAALAALDLDMVGLQECPEALVDSIADAGGFEHRWGEGGQALLSRGAQTRPVRHALRAGRAFVHADVAHGGLIFSVYVAHIGWNLDGDRQAREFVDEHLVLDTNPYRVVVGDFNDEHYSSQIDILEEGLVEAFFTAGVRPGARISWPATGFDGSEGSQLIDLVFFAPELRPLVTAVDVVNLVPPLSDHKPAWAELLFPSAGQPAFDVDPLAGLRDPRRALPPASARPENLLTNPGAEQGLEGWTERGGFVAVGERDHQTPRTGAGLFTGFEREGRLPYARASQTVDLSAQAALADAGRLELLVEGFMATGYQVFTSSEAVANQPRPYDDAEVQLVALDAAGAPLGTISSGRFDTLGWHPWAAALPAPPGTRAAQVVLHAHYKASGGLSDDAVFDDLYLGARALEAPHVRLGGDLVAGGGGEPPLDPAWRGEGVEATPDQTAVGLMVYPPWTASGLGHFVAWRKDAAEPATVRLVQDLDLEPYRAAQADGELALRWGGALRTLAARAEVHLWLEVLDADGAVFARLTAGRVAFAEWTDVEARTWIPPGARGARLGLEVHRPEVGASGFADRLYAWPERRPR